MPNDVTLVVDTNLFHECHKLDRADFPWADIGTFDVIELVVPEPVQAELDRQKKDTRSRVKKRAVDAVAWFREMLQQGVDEKVLHDANPRVVLKTDVSLPSTAHPQVLDPTVADDRIVGVAAALASASPHRDIRLLTHDTRPAAKARAIGLAFLFVPDNWLRAPEQDDQQKEIVRLRGENRALRDELPEFTVVAEGVTGEKVILVREALAPLTPADLDQLRAAVVRKWPVDQLESRFGGSGVRAGANSLLAGMSGREVYDPPTEAEIERYRTTTYDAWVQSCLDDLAAVLEATNRATPAEPLIVNLQNRGGRPAENVLIRFFARGSLLIAAPPYDGDRGLPSFQLPEPPKPPQGRWSRDGQPIAQGAAVQIMSPDIGRLSLPSVRSDPDPETFYYEPRRPDQPVEEFKLTCRRMRHGLEAEDFRLEIFPEPEVEILQGAVAVQVNASNMGPPVEVVIPVEVHTTYVSGLSAAQAHIDVAKLPNSSGRFARL